MVTPLGGLDNPMTGLFLAAHDARKHSLTEGASRPPHRVPPFFYGYIMVPVAMLMQICTSPGQTFAISAFKPAIRDSLQLTESQLSLAYMLGTLFAAIPLSVIGPASDRWGLRGVSLAVGIGLAATCYYASLASGFVTLLSAFFLLRFLGQGALTLLSGNTLGMWFRKRIGRMTALMSVGTAVAFAWIPGWLDGAIDAYGWRATYQALAVIVATLILPTVGLLFRNRPEDVGQSVDGVPRAFTAVTGDAAREPLEDDGSLTFKQALSHHSYYIVGLLSALWAMTGTGVVFHLFTLCEDRSLAESLPAALFKTFGLSMLAMQLAGGVLADYLRLNRLLGIGAVMLCSGLGVLRWADGPLPMHLFALLFGGGQGLLVSVSGVTWVNYFGREHLGTIRGTVWCLTVAGSGFGPFLMGWIRDTTGKFDLALLAFFAAMLPFAFAAWFATAPNTASSSTSDG